VETGLLIPSDKSCWLKRSMQHLLAVCSQESENQKFVVGVDLSAALLCSDPIGNFIGDRVYPGLTTFEVEAGVSVDSSTREMAALSQSIRASRPHRQLSAPKDDPGQKMCGGAENSDFGGR
jgi:hypothetical protein